MDDGSLKVIPVLHGVELLLECLVQQVVSVNEYNFSGRNLDFFQPGQLIAVLIIVKIINLLLYLL